MAEIQFRSLEDLQKYLQAQFNATEGNFDALKEIFGSSIDLSALTSKQDVNLKAEARIMEKLLQQEVERYYSLYVPRYMRDPSWKNDPRNKWPEGRTYRFMRSVRLSMPKTEDGKRIITVYFDHSLATHRSIFGGESGFVPILLNEGWKWSTGPRDWSWGYRESNRSTLRYSNKGYDWNTRSFYSHIGRKTGETREQFNSRRKSELKAQRNEIKYRRVRHDLTRAELDAGLDGPGYKKYKEKDHIWSKSRGDSFYHLAYYDPDAVNGRFIERAIQRYINARGKAVEGTIEIFKTMEWNGTRTVTQFF